MKYTLSYTLRLTVLVLLVALIPSVNAADMNKKKKDSFSLNPIGTVQKEGNQTLLVLDKAVQSGLLGLEDYSHVWVFWWFDQNDTPEKRAILQVHPRGNKENPLTGVFATRSPVRPNLIAQTLCKILSVDENIVHIEKIDAFDDTPVLDLKPYIPGYEVQDASGPSWRKK